MPQSPAWHDLMMPQSVALPLEPDTYLVHYSSYANAEKAPPQDDFPLPPLMCVLTQGVCLSALYWNLVRQTLGHSSIALKIVKRVLFVHIKYMRLYSEIVSCFELHNVWPLDLDLIHILNNCLISVCHTF